LRKIVEFHYVLRIISILIVVGFWSLFIYNFPVIEILNYSYVYLFAFGWFFFIPLIQIYISVFGCDIFFDGKEIVAKNWLTEFHFYESDIVERSINYFGYIVKFNNKLGKTKKVFIPLTKMNRDYTIKKLNKIFLSQRDENNI